MSGIDEIYSNKLNIKITPEDNYLKQKKINKSIKKLKEYDDKIEIKKERMNNKVNQNYKIKDAVKRPIRIDNSNNIFFINYKNENKTVKIKPGSYNLTEISLSIQQKVNEEFGIGKVKLKLTGSISDGLIYAEESKSNKILIDI
ncbi:MAG: hypothetical protein U5K53_08995 [Halanaerobiales bacterium]|nr:hypothetical protein [Halanaerobiales bacterium]